MSFTCKKCGQELPDEAKFCSSCGQKQSRDNALNSATNWVLAKPKRAIITAVVALLVLSGVLMVPDGSATAVKTRSTTITSEESKKEKEREERQAFNQASNELRNCEGEDLVDVLDTAEEYDYDYTLVNYDGEDCTDAYNELEPASQEQWEVVEVNQVNQHDRELSLRVDTKDHIANRETEALNNCVNQSVTDAQMIISECGYSYELQDAAGEDCKANFAALSSEQKTHWVVTSVVGIDTVNKEVCLAADTRENIEAAKRAAEEKAKQEAAAKKAAEEQAKKEAARKKKAEAAAAAAAAQAPSRSAGGGTVWIPRTGSKYHSNQYCSNMKNPSQVTEQEAINMGYQPCKKCY